MKNTAVILLAGGALYFLSRPKAKPKKKAAAPKAAAAPTTLGASPTLVRSIQDGSLAAIIAAAAAPPVTNPATPNPVGTFQQVANSIANQAITQAGTVVQQQIAGVGQSVSGSFGQFQSGATANVTPDTATDTSDYSGSDTSIDDSAVS